MMTVVHDLAEAQGAIPTRRLSRPLLTLILYDSSQWATLLLERASPRPKSAGSKPCVKAISPRTLSSADIEGGPAQEAMQNFVHEMLHDSPAALKIMSLWTEYEEQTTAEARFVKGKVLFPFP
jgi:hypothetical protein